MEMQEIVNDLLANYPKKEILESLDTLKTKYLANELLKNHSKDVILQSLEMMKK